MAFAEPPERINYAGHNEEAPENELNEKAPGRLSFRLSNILTIRALNGLGHKIILLLKAISLLLFAVHYEIIHLVQ